MAGSGNREEGAAGPKDGLPTDIAAVVDRVMGSRHGMARPPSAGRWPCERQGMTFVDCRPLVQRFGQDMERKLQANDHKRGIAEMEWEDMLHRLLEEVQELEDALLNGGTPSQVLGEAADVGNFAAAIAHWARERGGNLEKPEDACPREDCSRLHHDGPCTDMEAGK